MLPSEMQAIMAKILFFVFATCILCLNKVTAAEGRITVKVQSPEKISRLVANQFKIK